MEATQKRRSIESFKDDACHLSPQMISSVQDSQSSHPNQKTRPKAAV